MPGLRELKKDETILELQTALKELILLNGYESVRVEDIAELARVSRKTFYNYFPSKDSLFQHLANLRIKRWTHNISDHATWKGSAADKLRHLYRTFGKEFKLERPLWAAIAEADALNPLRFPAQRKLAREATEPIKDIIASGQKSCELSADYPAADLAWHLNWNQMRTGTEWAVGWPRGGSLNKRLMMGLDIFLRGLLA